MPEAPIDEHSNFGFGEDDIGSCAYTLHWRRVDPKPQTTSMKNRAQSQLRFGVSALVGAHRSSRMVRGRPGRTTHFGPLLTEQPELVSARFCKVKKINGLTMNSLDDIPQIDFIIVTDLDQSRCLLQFAHEYAGILTPVRARVV